MFLDRDKGRSLVIVVEATERDWDAAIAEAMPVIASFEFTR
jgi:hypothetical protein